MPNAWHAARALGCILLLPTIAAAQSVPAGPIQKQGYWWYEVPKSEPVQPDDPEALTKPVIPPMAVLATWTPPKIRKLIEQQRDYAATVLTVDAVADFWRLPPTAADCGQDGNGRGALVIARDRMQSIATKIRTRAALSAEERQFVANVRTLPVYRMLEWGVRQGVVDSVIGDTDELVALIPARGSRPASRLGRTRSNISSAGASKAIARWRTGCGAASRWTAMAIGD